MNRDDFAHILGGYSPKLVPPIAVHSAVLAVSLSVLSNVAVFSTSAFAAAPSILSAILRKYNADMLHNTMMAGVST